MHTDHSAHPVNVIGALVPREKSTGVPKTLLIFAVLSLFIVPGAPFLVVIPIVLFTMVFIKTKSKEYKDWQKKNSDKQFVISAIKTKSADRDAVMAIAQKYPSSWTIQAYCATYLADRGEFFEAYGLFNVAARMYSGSSRYLVKSAASCASAAGRHDITISMLDPYLSGANPGDNQSDQLIISMLSSALSKKGEFSRALEVANRLPLRKQNLDECLLLGLSSRAEAKIGLRQFADAQRDIDRIYAANPNFETLVELESLLGKTRNDRGGRQSTAQRGGNEKI